MTKWRMVRIEDVIKSQFDKLGCVGMTHSELLGELIDFYTKNHGKSKEIIKCQ